MYFVEYYPYALIYILKEINDKNWVFRYIFRIIIFRIMLYIISTAL